jgi:hypothetical protein
VFGFGHRAGEAARWTFADREFGDIFSDRLLTKVGVNIIDHGLAAAASVRL